MLSKVIIVGGKEYLLIQSESPAENYIVKELSQKYNNSDFVWGIYSEEYIFGQ